MKYPNKSQLRSQYPNLLQFEEQVQRSKQYTYNQGMLFFYRKEANYFYKYNKAKLAKVIKNDNALYNPKV